MINFPPCFKYIDGLVHSPEIRHCVGWTISCVKVSVYAIFVYLDIDMEVFTIFTAFVLIDSVMGAVKAVRLGQEFSFKTLLWGYTMKLCFLVIPLLVALLGKGLSGSSFSTPVDVVLKILIISEAYSVFGNIYAAKNRVEVKKMDAISLILKVIRTALYKTIYSSLSYMEKASGVDANNKIDKQQDNKENDK